MVYFTADEICETLQTAGLCDVDVVPVASLASIQDDIGNEQLITFRRRASGRSFRVRVRSGDIGPARLGRADPSGTSSETDGRLRVSPATVAIEKRGDEFRR